MNDRELAVREKFIDLGGRSAQRLGFARSLGQVYAALYLSPHPLGLQDLMDSLHISKGNASMSVRQLAEWGTVRRIWVKGDRKDFYEVNPNFSEVLGRFLSQLIKPRIESASAQLHDLRQDLEKNTRTATEEGGFMIQRIARIEELQKKAGKLLPLLETVLK